jgi:hypothetical protein
MPPSFSRTVSARKPPQVRRQTHRPDTHEGLFVGDAGYVLEGRSVLGAVRTAPAHDERGAEKHEAGYEWGTETPFQGGSRIETAWGVLKERFQLVFHLARGMTGLFRHYFYSIAGSLLCPVIDSRTLRLEMPV